MQDFKALKVWRAAHELTLEAYRITRGFPREEMFGLTSQLRRCASSVPANIAEGCGRRSNTDFARFLDIAGGSINEFEYHLLLARDLELMTQRVHEQLNDKASEVRRMLTALCRRVRPPRTS